MHGADLVHGTLPLLVTGTYVPPFLCGHGRRVMNHDQVHPTNSAFSHRPLRSTRITEEHATFPQTSYPECPLVQHPEWYAACLCQLFASVLCHP